MRLSGNMLSFLGELAESETKFADKADAVARLTHFGVNSAVHNRLIEKAYSTLGRPSNLPSHIEFEGYALTPLGHHVGRFYGKRYREATDETIRGWLVYDAQKFLNRL